MRLDSCADDLYHRPPKKYLMAFYSSIEDNRNDGQVLRSIDWCGAVGAMLGHAGGYEMPHPGSSRFTLTMPFKELEEEIKRARQGK